MRWLRSRVEIRWYEIWRAKIHQKHPDGRTVDIESHAAIPYPWRRKGSQA
jgi:hypothetical protein